MYILRVLTLHQLRYWIIELYISLTTFWCQFLNDDSYLNLSLIIPSDVNELPDQLQVEEHSVEILASMTEMDKGRAQDLFLDLLREDFELDSLLSSTFDDTLNDDADWDLLDY